MKVGIPVMKMTKNLKFDDVLCRSAMEKRSSGKRPTPVLDMDKMSSSLGRKKAMRS